MSVIDTIEDIGERSAVKDVRWDDKEWADTGHLRVRNYANATVFGAITRADDVTFRNVSTFENGDLKVNFKGRTRTPR